ncbi:MAG: small ribosomal subunit biogenesis GTPase RsgA [Thiohalophilus sp.]
MTGATGSEQHDRPADGTLSERSGTVIASYGARLRVETDDGQQHECHCRKNAGPVVTGDRVTLEIGERDTVVTRRLPRHSALSRPDSRGKPRIIAANIDQLLIVIAPRPAFKEALIDRYLVAAELSRMTPVIVLNKTDLLDGTTREEMKQRLATYEQIGYQVIPVSADLAHGLDQLRPVLRECSSIVVGQSGVGKSSLINGLLPGVDARVGDVSDATSKGTHTTTTAMLYHLPDHDGTIIDSPGIREFGLWQIRADEVALGFREFNDYREQCKFRNCLHRSEPGCAVREQVGHRISAQRYDSYLKLLASVEQENY